MNKYALGHKKTITIDLNLSFLSREVSKKLIMLTHMQCYKSLKKENLLLWKIGWSAEAQLILA